MGGGLLRVVKLPFIFLSVSGCSIYPLPDDVMAYSSRDIALQVRCETRYAIQNEIEENLRLVGDQPGYDGMSGTEAAAFFKSNPVNYKNLDWAKFSPDLSAFIYYKDTNVSYDFTLAGTEQNDSGLSASLLGQFAEHTDTIGIDIGRTSTRDVKRHFRIFDSFDSLAIRLEEDLCHNFNDVDVTSKLPDKSYKKTPNFVFPSTGALRIHNLIHDFLLQNETNNLGGEKTDWKTANMTDTITFTTKANGNVHPSAKFDTDGLEFSLASVGITSDNSRQDVHTIIVDISLPADISGQPVYDQGGRLLNPASQQARIALANQNLDRAEDKNFKDDFRNLGAIVVRRNP